MTIDDEVRDRRYVGAVSSVAVVEQRAAQRPLRPGAEHGLAILPVMAGEEEPVAHMHSSGDVTRGRRLYALLDLALEIDPAERRRVLEASEPDREILAEALALLEAEDEKFLAGSPARELSNRLALDAPLPTLPGYTLRRQLGQGGMGQVFLAVEDDSGREVALKMIRGFAPGAELRWRFELERLALSRLNHPAVAQFYGMGSAPDASPYVVMEYVDGVPISQYCDEHQLGIRERLTLLIAVCGGVEHAHRRQLLHRDLKPSNLLITESDGEPKPKVIDFGIARALDGSLQDGQYPTGTALVGTPAYMSPEALAPTGDSGVLDTRTDVYSLGVVLYELLVGVRPYTDTSTGSMNLVRRILEDDPPRPSTRWRTLDGETRDSQAARRGHAHQELRRLLAGDLDWIVMKAIEKDRDRRYGSVSELAADIERHLRLEPVTAHPPTLPYLAKRFVRRHRASVIAAVLVVLSLGAGFVARTVEANRAKKAQASAEASADFLADLIKQTRPYGKLTYESPISDLVAVGIRWLEEGRLEDPVARAKALSSFGLMSFHRGDLGTTERLWREALQLQRDHLPPDAADLRQSLHLMGNLSNSLGNWAETERYISEVLEIDRRSLQRDARHAGSLNVLARSYLERGMLDEAEEVARTSLAVYDSVGAFQVRARPLARLGEIALARGDLEQAESFVQQALDCYPDEGYSKSGLYETMATVRQAQGDWAASAADLRAALDIRLRAIGVASGPALRSRILLATALARSSRAADALETLAPVRSLLLTDAPEVHANPDELRDLGSALVAADSVEEGDRLLRLAASWTQKGAVRRPPEWD